MYEAAPISVFFRACRSTIEDRELIERSRARLDRSWEILRATSYVSRLRLSDQVGIRDSNLPDPGSSQSELIRLREQQAAMAAELQHRTRNLIAVVRSLANQTMRQTQPSEAFREQFTGQLGALSRVQGLLSHACHEPITLRGLIETELDAIGPALRDRIELKGPKVSIRKAVVQSFALALYELITTARRYGALASEHGRLTVTWRVDTREEDRRLVLDWFEQGLGPPEKEASVRRTYDCELIERVLPYVLSGQGSYDVAETELRCSIDLPLATRRESDR
ncbi:HWE histidine kinase domain-containing protein [Methylobacterium durans]|uniref:sensor histidine kinase n=1 Tax=Methylobacterium durans TaxID=2202825 RepID=UPI002AFFFE62|nr:HWE histidine kinase domain-containing protein [Methylobacterium durans]MEA1835279.1 HWE histidine kinase domain-containing protein [Methylobacterium durans]